MYVQSITMKIKNPATFLLIASIIWLIYNLNNLVYRFFQQAYKAHWFDTAISIVLLLVPISFILWALSYLKPQTLKTRTTAILLLTGSSVWTLYYLYYTVVYFSVSDVLSEPIAYLANHLSLFFPVSQIILAVLMLKGTVADLRKGAYWLLAGSLIFLISVSFSEFTTLYNFGFHLLDSPWDSFSYFLSLIRLVYPLALLLMSFALLQQPADTAQTSIDDSLAEADPEILDLPQIERQLNTSKATTYPTVLDWIADFLRALIPVFGLVFLFWRGQNKTDRTRRNWAIASLFWTAISLGLVLLAYYPVMRYFGPREVFIEVVLLIILLLLISWFVLVRKMRNDDYDYPSDQPDAPSMGQFLGWTFISGLPIAGLICLIVWAVDNENRVRKQWAIASLLWIGVMLIYYLYLYHAIQEMSSYSRFARF
jgi:hypothetical protein